MSVIRMNYIEAPDQYDEQGERSLFLAGSITGAEDWHTELIKMLEDQDITILNPRRKHFPIEDPTAAEAQIRWEHEHLGKATAISFWFAKGTLSPITLYELGSWSRSEKPMFIGVDPLYLRKADVEIQTKLARPDIKIVYSLEDLARQIIEWANDAME